jgi:hypothetical protein
LPSKRASNGRDTAGRFAPGNRIAKGNPVARQQHEIRREMINAVSVADLRAIIRALVSKAKQGDVPAAREILDRLIGKPKQAVDVATEGPLIREVAGIRIADVTGIDGSRTTVTNGA